MKPPVKVLIVDDSALIRAMFTEILSSDPEIEVVGSAPDPFVAREKIKLLAPDVVTLDVEMPRMDGISFLEKIMTLRPMPVVMVSTLTQKGADITIRALEIGAVDYIAKPVNANEENLSALTEELTRKVKNAALSKVLFKQHAAHNTTPHLHFSGTSDKHLIAIGASTGGVEAIREILSLLPANSPPVVITQHMPETFTASFARRLNSLCQIKVHEAEHGQKILAGNAYIAPGGRHLKIQKKASALYCTLDDGAQVSGHRPSVDVLFDSVAPLGSEVVAALLTGMGKDGAQGLLHIRQQGGHTIGQSEASCVVYGMPRAAQQLGAVTAELALKDIAQALLQYCESPPLKRAGNA